MTKVNATKVAEKDKDKPKDVSNIKSYTYNLKGHYAKKFPKKQKTSDSFGNLYVND